MPIDEETQKIHDQCSIYTQAAMLYRGARMAFVAHGKPKQGSIPELCLSRVPLDYVIENGDAMPEEFSNRRIVHVITDAEAKDKTEKAVKEYRKGKGDLFLVYEPVVSVWA